MLLQLYWFTCFPSEILLLCDQRHFPEWTEPDDTGGSLVPPCLWDHLTDSADSTRDPPSYLGSGPISNSLLHSDHPVLTSLSSGGCPLSFASSNSLEWKDSFPRNRAWVCQEVKVDFIPYFSLNVLYIRSAIFTWYVCTASILMNVIWPRKNIRMWGKVYKVPSLFCVMTIINVLHQKNYMCTDWLQSAIFVIV